MQELTLVRTCMTDEFTRGQIVLDRVSFFTLERPWEANAPNVSCIPVGAYRCDLFTREKGTRVYEIQNVPGRSAILIHVGNKVADSKGCPLLGMRSGNEDGLEWVYDSADAVKRFRQRLHGQPFWLEVIERSVRRAAAI